MNVTQLTSKNGHGTGNQAMTLSRSGKPINKESTRSAVRCAGQAYLSHLKGFLVHEVAQAGDSGEHVIALHRRNNVCKHRICPLRVPDGEDAAVRAHLLVRSLICGRKALPSSKQGGCTERDASHNACLSSGEPQGSMHTYGLTSTARRFALAALPKACRACRVA